MYDLSVQNKLEGDSLGRIGVGLLNAWNSHNVEQVMGYYAPDYEGIDVGQSNPVHGPDGKREVVLTYLRAFPDLHFALEKIVIEGNTVVLSWIATGTHNGPFMHIPPTGRPVHVRGVSMLTIENGQIDRALYVWDVACLLRHIGMLPDL